MSTRSRFAVLTDTDLRLETFPSIPQAKYWASKLCKSEFLIFRVSKTCRVEAPVGGIHHKNGTQRQPSRSAAA